MNIAQVAPLQYTVPPVLAGGTERVVSYWTEELVELGHLVTLFAAEGSSTSSRLLSQGPPADKPGGDAGTRAVNEAAMLRDVARRANEFDIVHCHTEYYHASVLAPINPRLLTTLHWRSDGRDRQQLFRRFPDLKCVCISESQQRAVPVGNRAGVVHHGLPADTAILGTGGGGYLAFLGRMTDQKRPDIALEVAERVGLPLKLAGNIDVGNPDYFDREVAPRLVESRHTFLGELDDPGKTQLLENAVALLMPIDWPEPFGMVVIEAIACGTPVVAWRRGSMPELIKPGVNGFLVDSVGDAAAAIAYCARLARRDVQRTFLERFTSERMARQYTHLYNEVILEQTCDA